MRPIIKYRREDGLPRFLVSDWLKLPGVLALLKERLHVTPDIYFDSENHPDWLGHRPIKIYYGTVSEDDSEFFACTSDGRPFVTDWDIQDILGNEVVWDVKWRIKNLPSNMQQTENWAFQSGNQTECLIYAPYRLGLREDTENCVKKLKSIADWVPEGKGTWTSDGYWVVR